MPHVTPRRKCDGTGRDTHIWADDAVQRGKGTAVFLDKSTAFANQNGHKHGFQLRCTPQRVPVKQAPQYPSVRRGGPGWQPSVHPHDSRRTYEAQALDMGSKSMPNGFGFPRRIPAGKQFHHTAALSLSRAQAKSEDVIKEEVRQGEDWKAIWATSPGLSHDHSL
eukprot:gnl/MRDRNA2_/MRDRNA2_104814_c0_seq1.p1 gnl/MRDRNA2_/MRDRNA2_104814_c0~~gnl/MRDRNA2_/MRDRNA2_104814_c0_seq1.p1  ORF type:complete len:175 (-),score=35.92 gnl/MRDRNA2_/MRDRNA2_104814_c0_seq1:36-530(-)